MVTKEQFEAQLNEYAQNTPLAADQPQITLTESNVTGFFNTQVLNIIYTEPKKKALGASVASLITNNNTTSRSYQFIYTIKRHKIDYQHGMSHKMFKFIHFKDSDKNWGNLFKAVSDLQDYDWIVKNEHARHILEIDPKNFYEMLYIARVSLVYLNKKRAELQC